jgi:hypothetical protein
VGRSGVSSSRTELGLGYVRVPTWCPFRLQIYFNSHSWLAVQMRKKAMRSTLMDNAFSNIDDWDKAQRLAHQLDGRAIHKRLDALPGVIVRSFDISGFSITGA